MQALNVKEEFSACLKLAIAKQIFIKIALGNYQGKDPELKQIHIREILIKGAVKLSFTYRCKTRDYVKNYSVDEGMQLFFNYLEDGFKVSTLFTTESDYILAYAKAGELTLRKSKASIKERPVLSHDRKKNRILEGSGNKQYLYELRITDAEGHVFKTAQDKYRQINHFVELVRPLIADVGKDQIKHVVDMGSGKGYLTFALYDYLKEILGLDVQVVGVEVRQDLVALCNKISSNVNFEQLCFEENTIAAYAATHIDLLMALHACDTATDDAIYKGITSEAKLIIVAPCCHKQVRREMEKSKTTNELSFLTKHGVFMERQAEMVTDGLRAMMLELMGYKTKVFEFVSDAHTPKNVLITAVKQQQPIRDAEKAAILERIIETMKYFGVATHHLGSLLNLPG